MIFIQKYFILLKKTDLFKRTKFYNLVIHFLYSTNYDFKLVLRRYSNSQQHIMAKANGEKEWKIFKDQDYSLNFGNYGIVILNRPITIMPENFSSLWNKASWRITVDGGTDRWFNFVKQHSLSLPLPNYVTGDFDSIKPETLDFCKQRNEITVENTPDQDYTDFDKALNVLVKTSPIKLDCFVAILEHSGRLDQTFSNLNTLSRAPLHGFLISETEITWLLQPGSHRIYIPDYLCNQTEICGILPFASPAKVSSKGLKWNLDNTTIEFGGLVSSSNTYDGSPEVFLSNDTTIIWTMSYRKK